VKKSTSRVSNLILLAVFCTNLISPSGNAATTKSSKIAVTMNILTTPSAGELEVTFYGQVKPAKVGTITIRSLNGVVWKPTNLTTTTSASGAWRINTIATAIKAEGQYQAYFVSGKTKLTSNDKNFKVDNTKIFTDVNSLLLPSGPGGRIHGADISRWQHPNDKPIDFQKMFDAGIRFLMIKGSDTQDKADSDNYKFLVADRDAAQAAGIYTGIYHYAYLPNTTDPEAVVRDAKAQAQKIIWRLATLGGYTERDLPLALDLEDNCVKKNRRGVCTAYMGRTLVTLWAETWLRTVYEKTGKKPFLYSYSQFLEQAMVRSDELRQYPLWLAHYALNPTDPIVQPGQKTVGCFSHSWSNANCSAQWIVWQYTSCGYGSKYGVPSARVDLNVYRGDVKSFLDLTKGTWVPELTDKLPINEPTQIRLISTKLSDTNSPVEFAVEVIRQIGTPVVTGTVVFRPDDPKVKIEDQSASREASGRWTLSLDKLPAGSYSGTINFVDTTNTHAANSIPVTFTLLQGPQLPPTPEPKPTVAPKPVDSCAKQFRN
jgi:lysozyme